MRAALRATNSPTKYSSGFGVVSRDLGVIVKHSKVPCSRPKMCWDIDVPIFFVLSRLRVRVPVSQLRYPLSRLRDRDLSPLRCFCEMNRKEKKVKCKRQMQISYFRFFFSLSLPLCKLFLFSVSGNCPDTEISCYAFEIHCRDTVIPCPDTERPMCPKRSHRCPKRDPIDVSNEIPPMSPMISQDSLPRVRPRPLIAPLFLQNK